MFFIDLNKFKIVNDTFGHDIGDEVLVGVSMRLKQAFDINMIYRYGGDEFVIVLPDTKMDDCRKLFSDIQEIVLEHRIGDMKLPISFSVGIKEINGNESIEEIILEVDSLMYRDKNFKK